MQHRYGGFRSKARKLTAVCLGGVLLLSSQKAFANGVNEGTVRGNWVSNAESIQSQTDTSAGVAICTAADDGTVTPSTATLTLSQSSLTATFACVNGKNKTQSNNKAVPASLITVCDGQTTSPPASRAGDYKIGNLGNSVTLEKYSEMVVSSDGLK
ncbi:UNVERIFIED_CONTAM: hypothetical protein HHA_321460 [Hammondia hammondi]|eukprot:XP_008888484.1 hypothetical protein HHA_321460 [Hammondia hammondi]